MSTIRYLAPFVLLSVLLTSVDAQTPPIDYSRRDGAADARAALASRQPVQIYTYEYAGRLAVDLAPGIVECSGSGRPGQIEPRVFVSLPEADFQQGVDDPNDRLAVAAKLYAGRFNRVMAVQRTAELQRRCPSVALDPRWPEDERKLEADLKRLQAGAARGR